MNLLNNIDRRSGSAIAESEGKTMHGLIEELFPICRSITGNGVRESLKRLQRIVPLELREVPTGTQVFDWTVPDEWNIRDAYIKNQRGERVVDFQRSNLHVVNYSIPVHRTMTLGELRPHLHSLPDRPDWIPYRTSYYNETWGFCLAHRQFEALSDEKYEVCIDASLNHGTLTYGELLVPGGTKEEVLFSSHCCHPSLCNDNLSGMVLAVALARHIQEMTRRRYSYRFLWAPGTIGAITWLACNEQRLSAIRHGIVLACMGDPGGFTYKRSRRASAEVDRAVERVLRDSGHAFQILDFSPNGYDERQFCSPGINLPVGCLMRTPPGRFPEYHTSADNPGLVTSGALAQSLGLLQQVVSVLEDNHYYVNLSPRGEPQLGRRGLYRTIGGTGSVWREDALLWVLNLSDGKHSLLDIAERSRLSFESIRPAAQALLSAGLLQPANSKEQSNL